MKFKNFLKRFLKKKVYKDEYGFEEVGNFIYSINFRELEIFYFINVSAIVSYFIVI